MMRDLLYGLRSLRRAPGFAAAATISLALGIGGNTLIFSLLDSTLLRPFAFPEPDRLAVVWTVPAQNLNQPTTSSISTYLAVRDQSRSFESVGAYNGAACGVKSLGAERDGLPAERILGQTFSPSLFRVLGVKPALGRAFTDDEDLVDNVAPVVIISDGLWQRRFGGDPAVLGKKLVLDRASTTVIGVLSADFHFYAGEIDFITPLCLTGTQVQSKLGGNTVVGRLKPGVSVQQAQAEITAIAAQLAAGDPERHRDLAALVEPLQRGAYRDYRSPLLILQGAVAFVLLIGCANVAGLLLARGASRRSEVAVRAALGAARPRIIRQLVAESIPLSVLGGIFGVLLSWGGLKLFIAAAPSDFPRLHEIALNLRVLGFTALVVIATTAVFALVPAIRASKLDLIESFKGSTRGGTDTISRQRLRSALVTAQIGLALVLLIGAGLMINSFVRVANHNLGADPANLLTFSFRLTQSEAASPAGRYRGLGLWNVNPRPADLFDRVLERVRTVPGVISAAASNLPPLNGGFLLPMPFLIEGRPAPPPNAAGPQQTANYFAVTPNFFGTMKIPVLRGRDFNDRDTNTAPLVMIINQTMARRYFADQDPLGQRVTLDFVPGERPREIIAVVGDTPTDRLQREQASAVYVPHQQQTPQFVGPWVYLRAGMVFVLRTSGNPTSLTNSIQRAVAEVDPNTPATDIRTVEQGLDQQVQRLRVYLLLLAVFGTVAAVLAATGIYGVMANSVAERTREIGIRMALGADSSDVLTMLLSQAARVIAGGVLLGLAGALALTGVIQSWLYGVTSTDPATYAAVCLLLVVVALLACVIPTRRAVAVDPAVALKYE